MCVRVVCVCVVCVCCDVVMCADTHNTTHTHPLTHQSTLGLQHDEAPEEATGRLPGHRSGKMTIFDFRVLVALFKFGRHPGLDFKLKVYTHLQAHLFE